MVEKKIKAQMSVWVVVGIVLVASVILFFLVRQKITIGSSGNSAVATDVESYLKSCSSEFVTEAADKIITRGGFVNPKDSVKFNSINIEFICKNSGFYKPCIQQHPLIIREIEEEIKKTVQSKVDECFSKMKDDFENNGAKVILGREMNLAIGLEQDKIVIKVERKVGVERNDKTERSEKYNVEISNPSYNLARIAAEISDQEARYCYFEFVGYNIIYPRYQIKKFQMSEPVKIYTIKDLKSGKEMNIAIRSCAIPAGA